MDSNSITTKLLTLLNVSATRPSQCGDVEGGFVPTEKLNKRRSVAMAAANSLAPEKDVASAQNNAQDEALPGDDKELDGADADDAYEAHFGPSTSVITAASRDAADRDAWATMKQKCGALGAVCVSTPEGTGESWPGSSKVDILERLHKPFKTRQAKQAQRHTDLQNDLLSLLSSYKDIYLTSNPLDTKKCVREAIALHALNHVTRKRRRILKNNERLTSAAKTHPNDPPPEDVQDQGFTRPSVLFLLPFRSSALDWFQAVTANTPSSAFQIENQARFMEEYGLPPGSIDKIPTAEPGTYPADHADTFKGNVDDNFRVGIKVTRKSLKTFVEFYGCDVILASPLGLRRSIEKEGNGDYLSSIEVLVIDQMDSLCMQNWEHVNFVLSYLNKLPKESHDTDFSRIKPWYLDGHSAHLRQSVLISAYESPETRALFNSTLKNLAGKIRTQSRWPPIQVPAGLSPNFVRFDCASSKVEAERRFDYFTTQLLPTVLKSAVQSENTLVFVPSSFDFIRVHNYFRKYAGVSFAVLSEYSSNQDISRARQAFFKGTAAFLLISERFHFYRRYKIRGIRNLIFYGPPEHPQFLSEFLSYPFLDEGVDVMDVTCRVLHCTYDWFRLERIAGTEAAVELVKLS